MSYQHIAGSLFFFIPKGRKYRFITHTQDSGVCLIPRRHVTEQRLMSPTPSFSPSTPSLLTPT